MNRSLVLVFSFLFLSSSLSAQKYSGKYREIDSLLNSGSIINNITALNLLNGKYKKDSVRSEYWIKYAQACFNAYKHPEAFISIDKGIKLDPKNAAAYFEKGRLCYDINYDTKEAIRYLNLALHYEKNAEYYFYRGIYRQISDSANGAMNDYDSASVLNYVNQGLYRNYSILLLKADQPGRALLFINKAIALNPEISENYQTRGEEYLFLLEPEKSCADFQTAIKMGYTKKSDLRDILCAPNSSYNKLSIAGDLLFKMDKYAFAIDAYTKCIEVEKDSSRFYLNRGYCYYRLKNYEEAEKDYLKALTLPKALTDLLYEDLGLLYLDQEKYDKCLECANKRIAMDPKNYTAYIDRGLAYRKLKKYKEAEKDFNTSLSIKPDFFRALGYRGFLYLEIGKLELALADAEESVSINPQYGYGYLVAGQAKQALKINTFCLDFYNALKYGWPEAQDAIKNYCK